jgi:prophage maintenance system killer protein
MNAKPLSKAFVIAVHEHQLELFGGAAGLRDEGMLESALLLDDTEVTRGRFLCHS